MCNDEAARESKSYDAHEGKLLLTRKLLSEHAGWQMSCLTGPSNRETLRDVHRRVEPVQVEQRERRTYIANVGCRLRAGRPKALCGKSERLPSSVLRSSVSRSLRGSFAGRPHSGFWSGVRRSTRDHKVRE